MHVHAPARPSAHGRGGSFRVAVHTKTAHPLFRSGIPNLQALLGVPKILAENSGYDPQDAIISLQVRAALRCAVLCYAVLCCMGSLDPQDPIVSLQVSAALRRACAALCCGAHCACCAELCCILARGHFRVRNHF